jgi:predicted acetyltransferase
MSDIRPVPPTDAEAFARKAFNAYPVLGAPGAERIARFAERMAKPDPLVHLYGCYRDGRLLGGMRMFDFTMNVFGELLPAGGVGFVATDVSHKKQGVARDLVRGFLRHYREKGASLAVLYPFRFDFYRAMGFGYGTKTQQFRLPPARFPGGPLRQRVRLLGPGDREALAACYDRLFRRTPGLIARRPAVLDALCDAPENRIAGYFEEGQLATSFFSSRWATRSSTTISRSAG